LNNRKLPAESKSIFLISKKYDIEPKVLVDTFIEALSSNVIRCGSLKVSCRNVNHDHATFLITTEEKVVSQFPIRLDILKTPNFLNKLIKNIPNEYYTEKKVEQKQKKINELRFRMKGINVRAKVIKIPPRQAVFTGLGVQAYVSNINIADETGAIMLSLWNNQIDKVHAGNEVEIENCYVARYAGELQLRMGRNGILSIIDQ
jgi:replication factor A1